MIEFDVVESLRKLADSIEDGSINPLNLDLRVGNNLIHTTDGCVDSVIPITQIMELEFESVYKVPDDINKYIRKTQVEIYQELFDEKYNEGITIKEGFININDRFKIMSDDDKVKEKASRKANTYASANAVRVWREQWKN